eukprot:GHVN01027294.1.p1 GENE.GHVN01027294.1~~GHVN01027294.1.p1  ORF type:complete len:112 (-),score=8.51 GHVN01027294.1:43-378(-)
MTMSQNVNKTNALRLSQPQVASLLYTEEPRITWEVNNKIHLKYTEGIPFYRRTFKWMIRSLLLWYGSVMGGAEPFFVDAQFSALTSTSKHPPDHNSLNYTHNTKKQETQRF